MKKEPSQRQNLRFWVISQKVQQIKIDKSSFFSVVLIFSAHFFLLKVIPKRIQELLDMVEKRSKITRIVVKFYPGSEREWDFFFIKRRTNKGQAKTSWELSLRIIKFHLTFLLLPLTKDINFTWRQVISFNLCTPKSTIFFNASCHPHPLLKFTSKKLFELLKIFSNYLRIRLHIPPKWTKNFNVSPVVQKHLK